MHVYPEACTLNVVEEDRTSRSVKADLVISPIEKEVLMSDALTEELEIIIMSPRKGLWKFANDPKTRLGNHTNQNTGNILLNRILNSCT